MKRTVKDNEAMPSGDVAKSKSEGQRKAKLDPGAQQALGRELRALYDEVLNEPVPDKFRELLDQLEEREQGGQDSDGEQARQDSDGEQR